MSLDVTVTGASLNTDGNIAVATPLNAAQAGYVILAGELAEPTDPTGRIVSDIRTSAQGRLAVGSPIILHNDIFSGQSVNSAIYQAAVSIMTIVPGTTTMNLNVGALTTLTASAMLRTYMFFPFQADLATFGVQEMLFTQVPQANCVTEVGFGQASGTTAPTDGAFFRFDAAGTFKAVLNNNGTEQMVSITAVPSANAMHKYKIISENDRVLYYVDGVCVASIVSASDMGMPLNAASQPWFTRTYNPGTPSFGSIIKIGYTCIGCQDAIGLGKSAETIAAFGGKMGSQGQSGMTMGSTSNMTNSLALGTGTVLTNTTCATTTLGGRQTIQPTLAAGTDGILFSYTVPVASTTLAAKTLYIKGIRINGMVTGALTGGPGVMEHILAYGHTAVSLTTAEGSTTKAPRRISLGFETFAATAAIGATNPAIYVPFTAPIAVNPGEQVAHVIKFLAGTIFSGTTGLISYDVMYDAFWE